MYGRVTPLPAAHPKARGFTQRWMGLYGFMFAFLLVEAVFLMVEKYNVSDDVLQGNYVLLDQGDDAVAPLEYIYQYPPLSNLDAAVGVLFLAHGCSHAATDFWSQYERTCPRCHGLPVEKAIVVEALTRDYIVVAASARDAVSSGGSGCWGAADLPRAQRVIERVRQQLNLPENIPNFLLGASSGGAFVGSLAVHMNTQAVELAKPHLSVCAINVQISALPRQLWRKQLLERGLLPSTHFVHMSRDARITGLVDDFLDTARAVSSVVVAEDPSGTAAAVQGKLSEGEQETAWFAEYTVQLAAKDKGKGLTRKSEVPFTTMLRSTAAPQPVTAALLVDRAYKVVPSLAVAQRLVQAFMENKVVDEQGMLLSDPRSDEVNWRDTVYRVIPDALKVSGDTLVADHSALAEILNVAYGQHEFTDEYVMTTFDFFDTVSPFSSPTDAEVPESVDSLFGF